MQKHYCRGFLYLCGVEVRWEGLEAVDYDQPVVGMFSHGSNMDPMILASGPLAYKSVPASSRTAAAAALLVHCQTTSHSRTSCDCALLSGGRPHRPPLLLFSHSHTECSASRLTGRCRCCGCSAPSL